MELTQVDLLDVDRSVLDTAVGAVFERPLSHTDRLRQVPRLTAQVLDGAIGAGAFTERQILRLTYASGAVELWQITRWNRVRGGRRPAIEVRARPFWMELDGTVATLTLSSGHKRVGLSSTSVSITEALSRILSSTYGAPPWVSIGSIANSLSGPVSSFLENATILEHLRTLAETVGAEWTATWDDVASTYVIDLVERIGDADASVRTIRETGEGSGKAVNRLQLRDRVSARKYFSSVLPLAGPEGSGRTIGDARWVVQANNAGLLTLDRDAIWEDGVLEGARVEMNGTLYGIASTTAPDTVQLVTDPGATDPIAFRDASGDELVTLSDPVAAASHGRRVRPKRFTDIPPWPNFLIKEGVAAAGDSLSGWQKVVGSESLSLTTDTLSVRNGDAALAVTALSANSGVRTASIPYSKEETGPVLSAHVALRVLSGTVQVQLVDSDGTRHPKDGIINGGSSEIRAYSIQGITPADGDVHLRVVGLNGGAEFHVDSATLVPAATAFPYTEKMGPTGLWMEATSFLRREGGLPERSLDGQVVDLSLMGIEGQPLRLGDAVTVRLEDEPDIESRITDITRELSVGSVAQSIEVTLDGRRLPFERDGTSDGGPPETGGVKTLEEGLLTKFRSESIDGVGYLTKIEVDQAGHIVFRPGAPSSIASVEVRTRAGAELTGTEPWVTKSLFETAAAVINTTNNFFGVAGNQVPIWETEDALHYVNSPDEGVFTVDTTQNNTQNNGSDLFTVEDLPTGMDDTGDLRAPFYHHTVPLEDEGVSVIQVRVTRNDGSVEQRAVTFGQAAKAKGTLDAILSRTTLQPREALFAEDGLSVDDGQGGAFMYDPESSLDPGQNDDVYDYPNGPGNVIRLTPGKKTVDPALRYQIGPFVAGTLPAGLTVVRLPLLEPFTLDFILLDADVPPTQTRSFEVSVAGTLVGTADIGTSGRTKTSFGTSIPAESLLVVTTPDPADTQMKNVSIAAKLDPA